MQEYFMKFIPLLPITWGKAVFRFEVFAVVTINITLGVFRYMRTDIVELLPPL
jgi:hypothetical protein